MVLQRGVTTTLWGSATPGITVTVTVRPSNNVNNVNNGNNGNNGNVCIADVNTTADGEGLWAVSLPPTGATALRHTVRLTCAGHPPRVLEDVVWGDVFVASGQSNTEFQLFRDVVGKEAELDAAASMPLVRGMTWTPSRHTPRLPLKRWFPADANPSTFPGMFSAEAWVFARVVFQVLGGTVPIGVVVTAVGSTAVEQWAGPVALRHCNASKKTASAFRRPTPSLWADNVQPLLPMAVAGFTWHQGESNVGMDVGCTLGGLNCAARFGCLTSQLIKSWAALWNAGTATGVRAARPRPFVMVQLQPYTFYAPPAGSANVALVRAAQEAIVARMAPAAEASGVAPALVPATDLGDPTADVDIHPRTKVPVGVRQAMAMLHLLYGVRAAPANGGPRALRVVAQRRHPRRCWEVHFSHDVRLQAEPACPVANASHCAGFVGVPAGGGLPLPLSPVRADARVVLVCAAQDVKLQSVSYGWGNCT